METRMIMMTLSIQVGFGGGVGGDGMVNTWIFIKCIMSTL